MRVAPAPLYNTAEDVHAFVTTLVAVLEEGK
jgi:kynureninase